MSPSRRTRSRRSLHCPAPPARNEIPWLHRAVSPPPVSLQIPPSPLRAIFVRRVWFRHLRSYRDMLKCSTAVTAAKRWRTTFGGGMEKHRLELVGGTKIQRCLNVSLFSKRVSGIKSESDGNTEGESQNPRCSPAAGKASSAAVPVPLPPSGGERGGGRCWRPAAGTAERAGGAHQTLGTGRGFAKLHLTTGPAWLTRGPHSAQGSAGAAGTVGAGVRPRRLCR